MAFDRVEFGEFIDKVRSRAEGAIYPSMTVEHIDAWLRALAHTILGECGGAALLMHEYPPLTGIVVDLKDFRYTAASGAAVLSEIAVQSLVVAMEPVRRATLLAFFDDGIVAPTEELLDFVINAHPHARGLIPVHHAEILRHRLLEIGSGEIALPELVDAITICEKALRMLSIAPEGRISEALGGRDAIFAHKDVAEKLLAIQARDTDGFHDRFMACLARRGLAQVPSR